MVRIALTGGIGTGKTYLSSHFRDMGIPVFYADDEAKKLYSQPAFLEDMYTMFHDCDIWFPDRKLDFQKLKKISENEVFLKRLSGFVHPYVMRYFEEWSEEQEANCVMMESAIIFEYGLEKAFDKVIVADAPEELRIKRIRQRNPDLTIEDILSRMAKQMPQSEKCKKADLVICTGETYRDAATLCAPKQI